MGSDTTKYIPVDKKAELNLGSTLNIKLTPRVMAYAKENIIFDKKGNVSGFDEVRTYQVQVSNFTDQAASVEYVKHMDTPYFNISDMKQSGKFERTDQDTIQFTIQLPPRTDQSIWFTVTLLRGERRWQ